MPKIIQLSSHIANLIAAGEVVKRPASVVKELLENSVDAGASKITVEIRDGGMTFLRVTDDGCGMSAEDAHTAFLRHATSKMRTAEDLAAIATMGFRGEALAAVASVSRIDLLTKTAGAVAGVSLHLEAGAITEESEAGCPEGTTIIIRNLFYNTPARLKFMKSDTVEGGRVAAAVQMQALAHPNVAFRFLRDGKLVLSTPGTGGLQGAVYSIYGKECAHMVKVESRWETYTLSGYVSKPTDSRPSRSLQTFFVNDRPVKSKLLTTALEEAYRNQIMVGKFPACVLHLTLPANAVDVNVHPAKTEVKFLAEKLVFDCVHFGVLGALNKTPDRPDMRFKAPAPPPPAETSAQAHAAAVKNDQFFRTMTPQEFRSFTSAIREPVQPSPAAAAATAARVRQEMPPVVRESVQIPRPTAPVPSMPAPAVLKEEPQFVPPQPIEKTESSAQLQHEAVEKTEKVTPLAEDIPEQTELPMPAEAPWRLVGELYRTYVLVEQDDNAFLIDKHAAHERILFEKLKANPEAISSQSLLTPIPCRLSPEGAGELLANAELLDELGFEVEEFGENTVLVRRIPMDLSQEQAAETLESLSVDLLSGRQEDVKAVRDEMLHTVACKAAIKAGWHTDEQELLALVRQVMGNPDLKYCPHGRPICITLSKHQLEKQFKRIV